MHCHFSPTFHAKRTPRPSTVSKACQCKIVLPITPDYLSSGSPMSSSHDLPMAHCTHKLWRHPIHQLETISGAHALKTGSAARSVLWWTLQSIKITKKWYKPKEITNVTQGSSVGCLESKHWFFGPLKDSNQLPCIAPASLFHWEVGHLLLPLSQDINYGEFTSH